ncbi:AcrR family transcriptional regulator [Deinococcus metalli]|uniref:AcrR family transcriptional regulator n=1 Tax=Deinococcus metalli TaxID=1141878 RepID=A0A7W8NQD6_9DEIO|nr:TetR/AcrR family transcriptional regulator [Deinococcus metalli]MBB5375753.1 AcrR family transcriptional regulator [Deinococcus metalli]GHF37317.1 TetR family transcriptional regulator [Deinococcus metalli]
MARPRQITDEQIVNAARDAFLEQGFGATTAEIARRAGVSEGTLFKRYARKEELFEAAVGLREYGRWRDDLVGRAGQGDVRRNLEDAALAFLTESSSVVPRLMAVFSRGHDPSHNPLLGRLDDPVRRDAEALAAYLRAETALGRLRPLDVDVTALTVMGALTHYVHREHMMPPQGREAIDAGRLVRGLFDVLWPGLSP